MGLRVFKEGDSFGRVSLGRLLRNRWHRIEDDFEQKQAKRAAKGIPPTEDPPCAKCGRPHPAPDPPEPYDGDEALDEVTFEAVSLSTEQRRILKARFETALLTGNHEQYAAAGAELLTHVSAIEGLEGADGAPVTLEGCADAAERWALLDRFGERHSTSLAIAFCLAYLHVHVLTREARGNCSASPPSSSTATTATPAQ